MKCKSCNSSNLSSILDLGNHAWCNNFLEEKEIGDESTYPLHLMFCDDCELLQLSYTVPKEVMFKNHTYVSSTTKTLKNHFLKLAEENKKQFSLSIDDTIIDIGGNDGTQLKQYISIGLSNVVNVESADNIAKLSVDNGVYTVNDYFNEDLMKEICEPNSVKLINASGVFFHLEELHSVIRGIKYVLENNGVLIVQFMYAGTMVEKLNFDGIYHEHLCYYTLRSLENLLKPYGMEIFDAYYSEIHSGSIITKISNKNSEHQKTSRFIETYENDKKYTKEVFEEFATKIVESKDNLKDFLLDIKKNEPKSKIYAYGAPAKGNTLLTYFNIDNKLIDKCVEINHLKIDKYLPISHIPIIEESSEDVPDYYLLLSHNFYDEIIRRNEKLIENGLKFIIPFPEPKIIKI